MKRLRKWLVEVLGFGQSESKGFIIFLSIVLLFSLASIFLPDKVFNKSSTYSDDLILLAGISENQELNPVPDIPAENEISKTLSAFDPNKMDYFDWKDLGIKPGLANRIISYRVKGGEFRKPEDLRKIYGFEDSLFATLAPFIKIKAIRNPQDHTVRYESSPKTGKNKAYRNMTEDQPIKKPNINQCDSSDLLFIKGIGPSRASRIIRYRNALGGFHNIAQLNEIYGLDSVVLDELKHNIILSDSEPRQGLRINDIDFKELLKHPYFDYNQTKVIINYRKQHGPFSGKEDLMKIKILDSQWLEKVEPYLNFESEDSKKSRQ